MPPVRKKREKVAAGQIQKVSSPRKSVPAAETNLLYKQVTTPSLNKYKIHLSDADVYYLPSLIGSDICTKWYTELDTLSTWYRPTIKAYGKTLVQSREIAAYASDPNLIHNYSGTVVDMHT